MSKRLFPYGPRIDDCVGALLLTLLAIASMAYNAIVPPSSRLAADAPWLHPLQSTRLMCVTANDTVRVDLTAADSVRLLGIAPDLRFWVQTPDGWRGLVNQEDFDRRFVVQKDVMHVDSDVSAYADDTLALVSISDSRGRLTCRTASGSTVNTYYRHLTTATAAAHPQLRMASSAGRVLSLSKFERLYIGRSFTECDGRYLPAISLYRTQEGTQAEFPLSVFNPKDGRTYRPTVRFNDQGVATGYALRPWSERGDFILRFVPFASRLADNGAFSSLIEKPLYVSNPNTVSPATWWGFAINILLTIIIGLGAVLWVCLPGFIPGYVMLFLVRLRVPFAKMGDAALRLVLYVVFLLGGLVWGTLMLLWGAFWPLVLLGLLVCLMRIRWRIDFLLTHKFEPKVRCAPCRTLYSTRRVSSRVVSTAQRWGEETERRVLGTRSERWREITHRITTWGNGYTERTQVNLADHERRFSDIQTDRYNVLYEVTTYEDTYECAECGHRYTATRIETTELDRTHLSSTRREELTHEH